MEGLLFILAIAYGIFAAVSGAGSKRSRRSRRGNAPHYRPLEEYRAPQEYRPQAQEYYPQQQEAPKICLHDRPETFDPAAPFREAYSGSLNYASTEGEGTESVPCSLTSHDHPDIHADAHPDIHAGAHADVHSGIYSSEEPISRPFLSAADRDSCRRAIIYAEILGRPRAMRR